MLIESILYTISDGQSDDGAKITSGLAAEKPVKSDLGAPEDCGGYYARQSIQSELSQVFSVGAVLN